MEDKGNLQDQRISKTENVALGRIGKTSVLSFKHPGNGPEDSFIHFKMPLDEYRLWQLQNSN